MLVRHVSLHNMIETPLHTPAHARLLEHTPSYNTLWALAVKKPTDNKYFHFQSLSGGQHRHGEASPDAKQLPHIPPYCWRRLLDVTRTVWETTITDNSNTRFNISLQDEFDNNHHHHVQRHELCTVANRDGPTSGAEASVWYRQKDTTTSRKSHQQLWLLQRRPLSKTGWISMVLPDRLCCWAWNGGFKQNKQSSMMQRCFGKS